MMTKHRGLRWTLFPALAVTLGVGVSLPAAAQDHPWQDTSLPPEQRAELLVDALSLDQKIQQIAVSRLLDDDEGEAVVFDMSGRSEYQIGVFESQESLTVCTW